MRGTQIYGLKEEAKKFLEENIEKIPDIVCPDCGKITTYKNNKRVYESAKECGMFDDGPELYEYVLKDKTIVCEVVHECTPWSSGLCIFLDLCDKNTGEVLFGWTGKEIFYVI